MWQRFHVFFWRWDKNEDSFCYLATFNCVFTMMLQFNFVTSMEPLIRKNRISYIRPLSLFLFEVPLNRKIVKNDSSTYFSYGLLSRHNGIKLFMNYLWRGHVNGNSTPSFNPSHLNHELFNRELSNRGVNMSWPKSQSLYHVSKSSGYWLLVCGIWDLWK